MLSLLRGVLNLGAIVKLPTPFTERLAYAALRLQASTLYKGWPPPVANVLANKRIEQDC